MLIAKLMQDLLRSILQHIDCWLLEFRNTSFLDTRLHYVDCTLGVSLFPKLIAEVPMSKQRQNMNKKNTTAVSPYIMPLVSICSVIISVACHSPFNNDDSDTPFHSVHWVHVAVGQKEHY